MLSYHLERGEFMYKQKKIIFFTLLLLLIMIAILYLNSQNQRQGTEGTKVMNFLSNIERTSNSDFLFTTLKNKKIEIDVEDKIFNIKGMEDKTIFLKVFGWDCKFCKQEIPELVQLKNELGEAFEVIAIEAQNSSTEENLKQMKAHNINYPIVSGIAQEKFYAYLQEKYAWTGIIPLTIVIGKGGKVLAFELGAKSYSLAELMKAALERN
ncbi:MAG: Unknown protein [uncultured Sulfurovum sp.]|uniref:Thioredoxin domain-containing protein n=1 Tax=uncultured Sulfurovum sp. TaxID=269237 RepID=A0A6S6SYZ5_9BACT|nr:MAG: Unknown protein [uncultured Sulfurovum sp.]